MTSAFFLLTGLCLIPAIVPPMHAQESRIFDKEKKVRYEERLKFYLDLKTKNHLVEMSAKERMLLENVWNLTLEIKQRGTAGITNDEAGFDLIYGDMQRLVADYTVELDAILAILDEINALSRTLEREKRVDLLDEFGDLKEKLVQTIESRTLFKYAPPTRSHKTGLVREYNVEMDSVLRIYDRLEGFERMARAKNDTVSLRLVHQQKDRLQTVLAGLRSGQDLDPELAKAYFSEAGQFFKLMEQLDKLNTSSSSLEQSIEAEATRRDLTSRLDSNLMKLLGYSVSDSSSAGQIDGAFQKWRAERVASFEARQAKYAVIKQNLLKTGSTRERSRMLSRDLSDALLNYAAERYAVADLQFQAAMKDYGPYFSNWDTVVFYRAESLYGRGIYGEAFQAYEDLLKTYPRTHFMGMALLRLVYISNHLKQAERFFTYFHRMDSLSARIEPALVARAYYLAGEYFMEQKNFAEAERIFAKIPQGTKYFPASRYLTGICALNAGNLSAALQIFKELAAGETLPWSNAGGTLVRNNALLKLGFIYYERGEYEEAMRQFEAVSRGSEEYDKSLLGKAWTQLKQGNWSGTVDNASALLQGYLVSDYTYEAYVLNAHCKRLLNQPESAMRDLRYVTNARGVLETSREYNDERRQIVAQSNELERMEQEALEHQDRPLYELIAKSQQMVRATLLNFNYTGQKGNLAVDDFSEERQRIYAQIQQFDGIIAEAQAAGLEEVVRDGITRRNRLIKTLETYQADQSVKSVNYLVDYPLAIKESGAEYRKEIVNNLMQELESEQERLKADVDSALALTGKSKTQVTMALDVQTLQEDLKNLQQRMDRFQNWLSGYEVEEVNSDFNRWADFSGFGLSDLTFQELEKHEHKIDTDSKNIASIDYMLRSRRSELEARLKRFDQEMRRLEETLVEEQIRLDKLEHQKYFDHFYFDTSESELVTEKVPQPESLQDEETPY